MLNHLYSCRYKWTNVFNLAYATTPKTICSNGSFFRGGHKFDPLVQMIVGTVAIEPPLEIPAPTNGVPANGLETKLYPHQSILIREINIIHTTPNHHNHKPIQPKYFSSCCNKLLAKLWLQPNKNPFLQKKLHCKFCHTVLHRETVSYTDPSTTNFG